jgi:competence protein ComEC
MIATLSACRSSPPHPQPEPSAEASSGAEFGAEVGSGEALRTDGYPRFTFLNVGQGDCIHVDCGDDYDILVDCGSVGGGDRAATQAQLADLLGPEDETVEVLVITHADADHFNYVAPTSSQASVLGERRIGIAMLGGHRDHYAATQVGQRLEGWLGNMADAVAWLTPADQSAEGHPDARFACAETAVYILAASITESPSTDGHTKNTDSVVLLFDHPEQRVMLAGDATRDTEESILARYSPVFLDVDLLKVAHHGATTSTIHPERPDWPWLSVVRPDAVVISAGHHGGFGHPRCDVLDALEAAPSMRVTNEPVEMECSPGRVNGAVMWEMRTITRDIRGGEAASGD